MKPATFTDRASEAVVTLLGLGKLPLAPGTWGTLGAAAAHALAVWLAGADRSVFLFPAFAAIATVASVLYCPWAARFYRQRDPKPFVIDEAAGYFLAVSFFPREPQWLVGVLAFVCFRVFDILKPFPVRQAEKAGRGLGIVLDDLLAGLYAAAVTALILLAIEGLF